MTRQWQRGDDAELATELYRLLGRVHIDSGGLLVTDDGRIVPHSTMVLTVVGWAGSLVADGSRLHLSAARIRAIADLARSMVAQQMDPRWCVRTVDALADDEQK